MHATGMKRFAVKHLGRTALAFGLLISSLSVVATLGLTGEIPSLRGDGLVQVADASSTLHASPSVAARDAQVAASGEAPSGRSGRQTQAVRFVVSMTPCDGLARVGMWAVAAEPTCD